jgi:hypothetical protein
LPVTPSPPLLPLQLKPLLLLLPGLILHHGRLLQLQLLLPLRDGLTLHRRLLLQQLLGLMLHP